MRKLFFAAAFAASVISSSYAQDMKDVQEKISKGKYDEAKASLDKLTPDPKSSKAAAVYYYYKGLVELHNAQTDTTGKLNYDAASESFNAYKKVLETDPNNLQMVADQNLGLFQLFDMHYNKGIRQYNNKNYDAAFNNFKSAMDVQDFIKSKNFTLPSYAPPALDTQLVNLTASSAYLAKKEDVAIPYFQRIIDAKVGGKDFKDIYALVAQYYLNKKDQVNADKYLKLGREMYPDEDYWISMEFGNVGNDKDAKLKRYEEMLQKYPNSPSLALDYAIEQFNHTYVWEKKPDDYTDRQAKLQTALDKATALNPNNPLAYFIASQHYYSQAFDLEEARRAIVGNTPAAAQKRVQLNGQIDKKYDDMAAASQKAYDLFSADTNLKSQDKINYRKVTQQLVDYYTRKKANDKVALYQNKLTQLK